MKDSNPKSKNYKNVSNIINNIEEKEESKHEFKEDMPENVVDYLQRYIDVYDDSPGVSYNASQLELLKSNPSEYLNKQLIISKRILNDKKEEGNQSEINYWIDNVEEIKSIIEELENK